MHRLNELAIDIVPEVSLDYDDDQLSHADAIGVYVFYEDFLMNAVLKRSEDDDTVKRIAKLVNILSESDEYSRNLAQVAILERLIEDEFTSVNDHLQDSARALVKNISEYMAVDLSKWAEPNVSGKTEWKS